MNGWSKRAAWTACGAWMLLAAAGRAEEPRPIEYDVVVYGATPGGIAAAVGAAKGGRTVLLVEPTNRIGGLATCGLSYADFRSFEALSGFFWDFSRRVEAHYAARYGADSPQHVASYRGTHGEPKVNLLVFEEMLSELPSIRLQKGWRLQSVETGDWSKGRRRIVSAAFQPLEGPARAARGRIYIDASYEGDLFAAAGENFHVGREPRAQYGETIAGDEKGRGDGQVQGYNFRLVMTQAEANRRMPEPPAGYDRRDFVEVLDHFRSGRLKKAFSSGHDGIFRAHDPLIPNGKADVNDTPHAPVRLSMPDVNDGYPTGTAAERAAIVQRHVYYNVGLLYFLQNDEAVPPTIRDDARGWGWCRDEFEETGGIPPQLYIREARRLAGQYVFTERSADYAPGDARAVLHRDAVAIGDYVFNCHGTGRSGSRFDGKHTGEFYKQCPPFQIPYGTIVPQKTGNLLVPVAVSASHVGFGALRLEPTWCALGQAAGWAADAALLEDRPVQEVDVAGLQAKLHADRSATIYLADVPPDSPSFAAAQKIGTRGGFHGTTDPKSLPLPKPKFLGGQYHAAFLGHAAELDRPLDEATARRWSAIALEWGVAAKDVPPADGRTTRGAWLAKAFAATAASK